MKIAILGIGGIGGVFGGMLARKYAGRGDVEVYFIARGENLRAIQQNGLRVITPREEFTTVPNMATDQPEQIGEVDVLLICTKTYHLEDAARQAAPCVGARTVIISALNGVDNAERLRAIYPQAEVWNGAVYISAALEAPGVARFIGGAGKIIFGPDSGKNERCTALADLFQQAGVQAACSADIRRDVWEKFLFISPLASATSSLGLTFGELRENPTGWMLMDSLLSEVEAVAAAEGVPFPPEIHAATLQKVQPFPPETKTSMQVDFEKGRPTELEALTGAVVRMGERHGVPVPSYRQVYEELKQRG